MSSCELEVSRARRTCCCAAACLVRLNRCQPAEAGSCGCRLLRRCVLPAPTPLSRCPAAPGGTKSGLSAARPEAFPHGSAQSGFFTHQLNKTQRNDITLAPCATSLQCAGDEQCDPSVYSPVCAADGRVIPSTCQAEVRGEGILVLEAFPGARVPVGKRRAERLSEVSPMQGADGGGRGGVWDQGLGCRAREGQLRRLRCTCSSHGACPAQGHGGYALNPCLPFFHPAFLRSATAWK